MIINQEALATNLLEVKMSPSILKALSADAEVAGKEELASQYLPRRGKSVLCCLHQSMGQSVVFTDPTWCFSLSHSARSLSIIGGQVDALLSGLVAVELPKAQP